MDIDRLTTDGLRQFREELISDIADILNAANSSKSGAKIMKAKDVCDRLQCAPGTLSNLRRNGILKSVKIGGTYYYSVSQIDEVMCINRLN